MPEPTNPVILCIDDYPAYAEMIGMMLRKHGGYDVKTGIVPLDFDAIRAMRPAAIVVNIVRKLEAIGYGPLHDFYTEVEGAKALKELTEEPVDLPLLITAIAVLERELPTDIRYDAFIEIPQKLDHLARVIDRAIKAHGTKTTAS